MKKRLQARIYWRSLRWWKAIKWQSEHEVDFGEFLVDFDFKAGEAWLRPHEGDARVLARFPKQENGARLTTIQGEICCGCHRVSLGVPFVLRGGKLQIQIIEEVDGVGALELIGTLSSSLRYAKSFEITPVVRGRDVYLDLEAAEEVLDLAILITSLLVFCRFTESGGS